MLQHLITNTVCTDGHAEQSMLTLKHVNSTNSIFGYRVELKGTRTIFLIGNSVYRFMANVVRWVVSSSFHFHLLSIYQ